MFELSNPVSCRSKFSSFLGIDAGAASVIDIVLTQPRMQCDLVDAEICGGLFALPTFADERDSALAELRRIWSGQGNEPFMKAIG